MKVHLNNIFFLFIMAFLVGSTLQAQTQKIGYVNSAKIMQEFPEAKDAQKQIDAFQMKTQDSANIMKREYQEKAQEYQKKKDMLNEQAKSQKEQELILLEQNYSEFQERKLGRDGELAALTQRLLDPIRDKIFKAIAIVAKEEKLSFVFDKSDALQLLLYGDLKYDYTNLTLDRLTRGTGK